MHVPSQVPSQVPLEARTRRSVLESLVEIAGRTWQVWEPALLLSAIFEREEVMSTGFESGVAIPHPRNPLASALGASIVAYGRAFSGIPFGAPKRTLTDIFFLVLCRDSKTHLSVLARLGRLLQVAGFLDELRDASDSDSSFAVISYTNNWIYVVFAAVGSWIGAYISLTVLHRPPSQPPPPPPLGP